MQNLTETLNSTLSFSHFASPFAPNLTTHGAYRWNHTTSAAVVYRPASLLTPWPILATGLGISFIQAVWTYFSNYHSWSASEDDKILSTKKRIIDSVSIVVCTIRSWTAFIRAIKAISNNSARAVSPIASFTLAICMFPGAIRPDGIQGWLMWLNILFAYTSYELALFSRYYNDADFYGSLYLAGGNCPALGSFESMTPQYVGCNPDPFSAVQDGYKKTLNNNYSLTMVGAAELFLGMAYNITLLAIELFIGAVLLMLLLIITLLILAGIKRLMKTGQKRRDRDMEQTLTLSKRSLREKLKAWKDNIIDLFHGDEYNDTYDRGGKLKTLKDKIVDLLLEGEDDDPHDTRRMRRRWAIVAILVIGLSIVIILPITYSQQTREKTLKVLDSSGPLLQYDTGNSYIVNSSLELNGSWTDCFDVPIVSDRLGFLEFWWDQNKARPLDWLALM